jgi:hypothetical protein
MTEIQKSKQLVFHLICNLLFLVYPGLVPCVKSRDGDENITFIFAKHLLKEFSRHAKLA